MESFKEAQNSQEKQKISEIITARGSVYKYLSDGRTERFKTSTGEKFDPQDALVFIPPWELIKAQAKDFYPNTLGLLDNEVQYEQLMLEYCQSHEHSVRIIDQTGKELWTQAEIEAVGKAFLSFIDKSDTKNNFTLPVSTEPKIGYTTFDTRKYSDKSGHTTRERHIGNKVVDIHYID